ncbi:MAG: DNA adenine methylase [Tistlia sp.]|uniref:DNA adenine methylase n=1 Tax=Tistlia sp. TaxID=3057121 RepID=UPI0034A4D9EC
MPNPFRPEYPTNAVRPVHPPAAYIGGKRHLADRLAQRIDHAPHVTFAEVFLGMGGVFLRRTRRPRAEVVNDWSQDVATLFRVLQRHYVPFLDTIKWQITGRGEFERLVATDPETLTDLERSARFLYLQRTAYGGKVTGRTFGVDVREAGRFNVTRLQPILEAIHERLAGVVIERLPWADFLVRYDAPGTLFYLDPPYWGSEGDYGRELFGRADFAPLVEQLGRLKGRWILSINATPETRALFADFELETVETRYSIARESNDQVAELIVYGPRPWRREIQAGALPLEGGG